jgi:hypothetical protein
METAKAKTQKMPSICFSEPLSFAGVLPDPLDEEAPDVTVGLVADVPIVFDVVTAFVVVLFEMVVEPAKISNDPLGVYHTMQLRVLEQPQRRLGYIGFANKQV